MTERAALDEHTSSLATERRSYVRVKLQITARIIDHDHGLYACSIIDISAGGAQILTSEVPPADDAPIIVGFRLGREYNISAVVVWQQPTDRNGYLLGVQWTSIGVSVQEQLTREILRIAVNRRRFKK